MKRTIDIVISFGLILLLSPLLLLVALLSAATNGLPIFFRQQRVGKGGRLFTILKFRTMRPGTGPRITAGNDSRITPMGHFLRKWKIDELPQLFNVLRGNMSLVGPRPEVPEYVSLYTAEERRILEIRPGITDWAAIEFRNEQDILAKYEDKERAYREVILPAKLKLNLRYLNEGSTWTDLRILLATARVVLFAWSFVVALGWQ